MVQVGRCNCSESAAGGCLCGWDSTTSILVTGSGAAGDPFEASVKIDPDASNLAQVTASGLLVLDGDSDIEIIGIAGSYVGSPPAPGTPGRWKKQLGNSVFTSDASGVVTITFPTPFTGGVATIIVTNGDTTVLAIPSVLQNTVSLSGFQVRWIDYAGSVWAAQATRTNWEATGWN